MLNIVITGAPGSGKGTQSDLIVKNYGLFHISTGDMLRAEIKAGSKIGKQAEQIIADGRLVPDEVMIEMLHKQILEHKDAKGFIFDGFPRTVAQAGALDKMLAGVGAKIDILLVMNVKHETLVERLILRGQTSGRADDNKETIEKRLAVYTENTLPVIEFYRASGRLTEADNNTTVDECFAQIKRIIESHKG
ncbi:MAG: adenylate kinase [Paludibacteraceae bacterium]|nr:adenylate kinase [Paludibacteraceae bacterium]